MKKQLDMSSMSLHITAMTFMLLDHLWATLLPSHAWMTCLGRISFPIFSFLTVEGFYHTENLKRYIGRMFLFAILSEFPFNLMYSGNLFYPYHQNVLWTLLLGLICMSILEKVRRYLPRLKSFLASLLVIFIFFVIGMMTAPDYYGPGILTILTFYFFHQRKWWCFTGQIAVLYWLNVELLGGLVYPVTVFGYKFEIVQQGFALCALLPIWLYHGRKGYSSKIFQYFCYAFYPVHCLILALISRL